MAMPTNQRATNRFLGVDFRNDAAFTGFIVLVFLFFGIIGILKHEMWLDELQAWLIARDSSSISDLFKNLRYEGHPGLWHSCLYVISRFTRNPTAMQFFHLLIATGVIYIFTNYSPFTRLQKILFCFSYFPFYEYSIISRNYSLGVLLIFLFCKFFNSHTQSYLLLSILLALLANTNVYGLILAICFAMTLLIEIVIYNKANRLLFTRNCNLIISIIVFMLGIVIALIQIIPPADAPFQGNVKIITEPDGLHSKVKHFALTLGTIWRSYIPIPNFFKYQFWNTNILTEGHDIDILQKCALIFSLGLLFFSMALFNQKPVVLFLYLSGTFSILLFTYVKFYGGLRHHGHLFILFIACIWISDSYSKSNFFIIQFKTLTKFINRYKHRYLKIILCTHVVAGIFAFSMDLIYPFSASEEVSSFIESQRLNDTLIVGSKDYAVSPIAALLDKKIYYPESDTFGSFIVWNNRNDVNSQEVLDKINKLVTQTNTNALLILNHELDAERPELSTSELSKSSQSIAPNETYHLYLIQKKPVVSQPDGN